MLAYVLEDINKLEKKDVPIPNVEEGWALVKVRACSICSSDIPRIYKSGTYHFPTIPGHEVSGSVVKVGGDRNGELIGRRVGIFPLIPCKQCEQCDRKNYEMCKNYDYIGSRRDGGFAEYLKVPVWNLIELPDCVPFENIALMEPLSVALHATKVGSPSSTDHVAIIGTGMIGLSVATFSKRFAKKIDVLGVDSSYAPLVERIGGLTYLVNAESHDRYDVVFEAVGINSTLIQAINIAKPGGKIVLIGNPSGDVFLERDVYWKILRKQLKIVGSWNSKYDGKNDSDWTEVKDLIVSQSIDCSILISHRFDETNLMSGLELMRSKTEPYCRVMISWKGENE